MPLPLPDLDTRRWEDLIAEGRALIPRYAPGWTDHNVHDPGITVMELLAWLVEQDIYRVNRVPDRHRRKFLALAGFPPRPPRPAVVPLAFTLRSGAATQPLPAGLTVSAARGAEQIPFLLQRGFTVVPAGVQTVQVFDGTQFTDHTRAFREGLPLPLFGANPESAVDSDQQPALYLGLDAALPVEEPVSFWFWFTGAGHDAAARTRLLAENAARAAGCRPVRPAANPCVEETEPEAAPASATGPLLHHAVQTIWEYWDGARWQALNHEAAADDTRAFTLDGAVRLTLPATMAARAAGTVSETAFYLRCRLAGGRPDAPPTALGLALNCGPAEQRRMARQTLTVAAGVEPPAGQIPQPGQTQPLTLRFNARGEISALAAGPGIDGPELFILGYQAATASDPGYLTVDLVAGPAGSGWAHQRWVLPDAPVAGGAVELWTGGLGPAAETWAQRPDFDASTRVDAHFVVEPTAGTLTFGDGEMGSVAPAGAPLLARYAVTRGAAGNLPAGASWTLSGADDAWNDALLSGGVAALAADITSIANPAPAAGGAGEETIEEAAGRAAATLWAHERLLTLCPPESCPTLDQLDRDVVLAHTPPPRATTLRDYERLALNVPGTDVRRARAWAGLDARFPCFQAPGTVTVVIVPALPAGRPVPTVGLLEAVRGYLDRRRTAGTRLVVVGPTYVTVRVQTTIRARRGADVSRVQSEVGTALDRYLDPLAGGPAGRGWPFGRDVYRTEILQVIDGVPGVDHVLDLELFADDGAGQCGNLCVGPATLVTAGAHALEVQPA